MASQRTALIVANDTYEQEALSNLQAPAADAAALEQVLNDPQIGDFSVRVMHNQPAHVIELQIEEMFSTGRPEDVLLLHYSGHGLKSESGELFFAATNTRPALLGATAVPADFVQRCMRTCRSRTVVLLLDCCYGGAFAAGVKVRAAGDANVLDSFPQGKAGGRGRAVITACSAMEFAIEGNRLNDDQRGQPSVFTTALVQGLATGEADRDSDGQVSINELYDYVFDKVQERNPHQTPGRQFELEGELYLARSRRRPVRPAPVPDDLRAALADPNVYTRLGAVNELRSRLASDNLAAAVGAYEMLGHVADADISYVAAPAAEARNEAAVHPAQRELHFGRVEQGSAPPWRTVRLLGPPLARACNLRPSHDWIHASQTPGGLEISIGTSGQGRLHGSLGLHGPTGEAVIAIDVDLVESGVPPRPVTPVVTPRPAPAPSPSRPSDGPPQQSRLAPALPLPPVRSGAAFAGLWVALAAAAAGMGATACSYPASGEGVFVFFKQVLYVVPAVVAVAGLLLPDRRRLVLGLLQGLWWPSVAWLAWDPVSLITREFSFTGTARAVTGDYLGLASGLLGVTAVVLLLRSWPPGPGRNRARGHRGLSVALACCIGSSQVVGFLLYPSTAFERRHDAYYAVGIVAVIVGLIVSSCAASPRNPLRGALVALGWTVTTLIALVATVLLVLEPKHQSLTVLPAFAVTLEFLLLAVAFILAAIHAKLSLARLISCAQA